VGWTSESVWTTWRSDNSCPRWDSELRPLRRPARSYSLYRLRYPGPSVLWYWESKSVIQMQRRGRRQYGEQAPRRQSTRRWLDHFQETGSAQHKKGAGRPLIYADIIEIFREAFQRSPSKSTHRASREPQTYRSTVQKFYTV
jgi:hypothetical protein